jgi:hypothetical protein
MSNPESVPKRIGLAFAVGALAYVELLIFALRLQLLYTLLLALLPAVGAGYLFFREVSARPSITESDLLRVMIESLYPGEKAVHYRANAMWFDEEKGQLYVRFAHNMDGYVDRYVRLRPGQGCAGESFQSGNIKIFDFTRVSHAEYGIDTKKVPIWADLHSIISYPIRNENGKKVGVLSIDTDKPTPETKFEDKEVQKLIGIYAQLLLKIVGEG